MKTSGHRRFSRLITFALSLSLSLSLGFLFICFLSSFAQGQSGGELRFCLRTEPKTFDPLLVDDDASL